MCRLLVSSRCGRTGEGHLRVCWFILPSPRTLSRSATIISIHVGRTPNKDIHKASMTAKGFVQVDEAFFILSLFVQFRG